MSLSKINNCERGSLMVEGTLCILLFLGIIGLIIDVSTIFFRYATLHYATGTMVRKLSVNVGDATTVSALEFAAKQGAGAIIQEMFGLSGDLTFEATVSPSGGKCVMNLVGQWQVKCFFCIFSAQQLTLIVQRASTVSDECLVCN